MANADTQTSIIEMMEKIQDEIMQVNGGLHALKWAASHAFDNMEAFCELSIRILQPLIDGTNCAAVRLDDLCDALTKSEVNHD
ncbi:hypothetical protein [Paraburkholderia caballeronis]|uniref:Uncharacterized protein n=1 Tax=Paraburkholderia caballeronis TaxID=416943 RepID=A0A1H7TJS4_9BURK|nr:hypothetical protein [Paraburkholderia caballeronis]PXW18430.1 hypothetical protein C7403_116115 [Paraburkholderia caballeronis]PXW95710.1 hypothetical protein C7407_116115 [Paraburkholderia caballeronis]RAJ92056.1 hypothetical protein C7409_116115 [Paraburkholderia caballeronis]SEB76296.1 hypothetical protein SAMN05445871_1022 [Paraburkholderia caballeronis]SEL85152.1 hypothetical protein SAMN05192542_115115 [Paraburkholderia caballeronis]